MISIFLSICLAVSLILYTGLISQHKPLYPKGYEHVYHTKDYGNTFIEQPNIPISYEKENIKFLKHIDEKLHVKAVVIVILSLQTDRLMACYKRWVNYMVDMNPNFYTIFVVYDHKAKVTTFRNHLLTLAHFPETFDKIHNKTIRAMLFTRRYIEYDYILRSNLSTIWDFNMFEKLLDTLPPSNVLAGPDIDGRFIMGTGMLFSKDIVDIILEQSFLKGRYLQDNLSDDILLSDQTLIPHEQWINIPHFEVYTKEGEFRLNDILSKDYFFYRVKGPDWFKDNCPDLKDGIYLCNLIKERYV